MKQEVREARARRLETRALRLEAAQKRYPHKSESMKPAIDGLRREVEVLRAVTQIESDGVTVWVNGEGGYCLGRFGRMGIDVHCKPSDANDGKECLHCTHGPVTAADWETFKAEMLKHHGVTVTDKAKPERFR